MERLQRAFACVLWSLKTPEGFTSHLVDRGDSEPVNDPVPVKASLRSVPASSCTILTSGSYVYEAEVGDAAIDYAVVASVDEAKVDPVDPSS